MVIRIPAVILGLRVNVAKPAISRIFLSASCTLKKLRLRGLAYANEGDVHVSASCHICPRESKEINLSADEVSV